MNVIFIDDIYVCCRWTLIGVAIGNFVSILSILFWSAYNIITYT